MDDMREFTIKTEAFEGPLELLLDLIEKRKLLINDISLAAVTDEYMQFISELEQHPLRETAHFVLVASTLLLIKSKSLLPVLELTDEETESIEELQERLRLYQIYRSSSQMLFRQFGKQILFERTFTPEIKPVFVTDKRTNTVFLHTAMVEILKNLPKKVFKRGVSVQKMISLGEMIERLKNRIEKQFKFGFADFAGDQKERVNVIVSFLAVLELVKQGIVMVRQERHCTDIEIERENIDTPRY